MEDFGLTDPRCMPGHLFSGSIKKDYSTSIKGEPSKQNYSVYPRYWYFDTVFKCVSCLQYFTWTANDQKTWFETYYFWISSCPQHCQKCRVNRRVLINLQKEYDLTVSEARRAGTYDQKMRIIYIVSTLENAYTNLAKKMTETKRIFEQQIEN